MCGKKGIYGERFFEVCIFQFIVIHLPNSLTRGCQYSCEFIATIFWNII